MSQRMFSDLHKGMRSNLTKPANENIYSSHLIKLIHELRPLFARVLQDIVGEIDKGEPAFLRSLRELGVPYLYHKFCSLAVIDAPVGERNN